MSIASTFRNLTFSLSLATAGGLAQSAATPPENLDFVLNAKAASNAHSEAFFGVIQEENFYLKPQYVFDVTQRCKKSGAVSLNEFAACTRVERSRDFDRNMGLGLAGVSLFTGGLGALCMLERRREEFSRLGERTFSHPFE